MTQKYQRWTANLFDWTAKHCAVAVTTVYYGMSASCINALWWRHQMLSCLLSNGLCQQLLSGTSWDTQVLLSTRSLPAIYTYIMDISKSSHSYAQSNLAKAASNLWGKMGLPSNTMFLGSPRVSTPSRTSIRSAVIAQRSRVKPRDRDRLTDAEMTDCNRPHVMHLMWHRSLSQWLSGIDHLGYGAC